MISPSSALASSSLLVLALSCVVSAAAPFSSWAGKRSDGGGIAAAPGQELRAAEIRQLIYDLSNAYRTLQAREEEDDDDTYAPAVQVNKRDPFSSWAGKRAPFSSWAGKRAPFSSWAGKRAPFSSWAGKRSAPSMEGADEEEQPLMMESHRIKRSSGEEEEDADEVVRERRGAQFSAWGGKRRRRSPNVRPVRVLRPSRAAFSAWGGKR